MAKKDPEQLKLDDKSNKEEVKEKKPRAKKKVEYEGSRWSSLGLLIFTILIGFFLYLSGQH
jgi:hypothetical protein